MHTLLKGLEKIANSANIPMVVAGDLNSIPGSAPHALMMRGYIEIGHEELQVDPLNMFTEEDRTNKLSHSLNLQSAYAMAMKPAPHSHRLSLLRSRLGSGTHEPQITNVTHDFKATLDYICCSQPALTPTALLELPCCSELLHGSKHSGLPTPECPSDHIALMAEFEFSV